jgi:hypothetical protein
LLENPHSMSQWRLTFSRKLVQLFAASRCSSLRKHVISALFSMKKNGKPVPVPALP